MFDPQICYASPRAHDCARVCEVQGGFAKAFVIPGRHAAASPESMNTGLWNMDSGLSASPSPGMTIVA
jgi:hypothetical protein